MTNTNVRPAYPDKRSRGTLLKRSLPWIPRLIILVVATFFGILFLMGGINRARAWFSAPVVLPALGIITLLGTGLYALVKRRITKNTILTGGLCLLCLPAAIPSYVPMTYPASVTAARPSVTVRLPANAPLKVMWGGDTVQTNYHARTYNERWAYDFVVAPFKIQSPRLEDYGCYGVPIVAPAAGVIVGAHDGEADRVPGILTIDPKAPVGNYVFIRLDETGTYLVLAHLKPGSIQVATGQKVEEGQVIAQCGNTGNTSEPHIHIHHQREDPTNTLPGLAEGLPLFFRDLDAASMPEGGSRLENGNLIWTGPTVQHIGP
jgi:hypothetical protein